VLPFYALYLRENAGLRGSEVGAVVAAIPLAGILAQSVWGTLADRSGRRTRALVAIGLGGATGLLLLWRQHTFAGFLVVTAFYAFFVAALAPMAISVSLALLGRSGHGFGRVRAWGTLGYGCAVLGFPLLLSRAASAGWIAPARATAGPGGGDVGTPGLGLLFPAAAVFLAVGSLFALALPSTRAERIRAAPGEWRRVLGDRCFQRLLAFAFFVFLSMQGPMQMFPLLVRAHGGDVAAIAHMWFWMIVLEVPLVFVFGASVARLGARNLVAIGLVANAVRWLVSGYASDLGWITAVQVLHGVTVWGVMLALPLHLDSFVPAQLRATGQGWLAVAGAGVAGVLSSLLAGWLVDVGGGALPARAGGWLALACALAMPWALPRADAVARLGEGGSVVAGSPVDVALAVDRVESVEPLE